MVKPEFEPSSVWLQKHILNHYTIPHTFLKIHLFLLILIHMGVLLEIKAPVNYILLSAHGSHFGSSPVHGHKQAGPHSPRLTYFSPSLPPPPTLWKRDQKKMICNEIFPFCVTRIVYKVYQTQRTWKNMLDHFKTYFPAQTWCQQQLLRKHTANYETTRWLRKEWVHLHRQQSLVIKSSTCAYKHLVVSFHQDQKVI